MNADGRPFLETITAHHQHLHRKLRELGDGLFASVLSEEDLMVQINVVNCMGFMNPSEYDSFPKTKLVLSSAPKI